MTDTPNTPNTPNTPKAEKSVKVFLKAAAWTDEGRQDAHTWENDGEVAKDSKPVSLPEGMAKSLFKEGKAMRAGDVDVAK